jgi:hypothetical protein
VPRLASDHRPTPPRAPTARLRGALQQPQATPQPQAPTATPEARATTRARDPARQTSSDETDSVG